MSFKSNARRLLSAMDMFSAPITLYRSHDSSYETGFGGLCTLTLIIGFAVVFSTTLVRTITKQYIIGATSFQNDDDPSLLITNTNAMMFSVGFTGADLTTGPQYFQIILQYRIKNSTVTNTTIIPLSPCNRSHWTDVNQQFGATFDRLTLEKWLCPPLDLQLEFQGKFSSVVFKYYRLLVNKCAGTTFKAGDGKSCVTDKVISDYITKNENFQFNFYFINALLNPEEQEQIKYYIEDANYFPFTNLAGVSANLLVSSYFDTTDETILPVVKNTLEKGGIVNDPGQMLTYQIISNTLVRFYIRKSPVTVRLERSFRKLDDTISYIGGLFSSILGLFFFVKLYNQYSYELEMASVMFTEKKTQPVPIEKFTPFTLPVYLIGIVLEKIGINIPWKAFSSLRCCQLEARRQLDIKMMITRVQRAERMGQVVLGKDKLLGLRLQRKKDVKQMQKQREQWQAQRKLKENLLKNDFSFDPSMFQQIGEEGSEAMVAFENSRSSLMRTDTKDMVPMPSLEYDRSSMVMKNLESHESIVEHESVIQFLPSPRTIITPPLERQFLSQQKQNTMAASANNPKSPYFLLNRLGTMQPRMNNEKHTHLKSGFNHKSQTEKLINCNPSKVYPENVANDAVNQRARPTLKHEQGADQNSESVMSVTPSVSSNASFKPPLEIYRIIERLFEAANNGDEISKRLVEGLEKTKNQKTKKGGRNQRAALQLVNGQATAAFNLNSNQSLQHVDTEGNRQQKQADEESHGIPVEGLPQGQEDNNNSRINIKFHRSSRRNLPKIEVLVFQQ